MRRNNDPQFRWKKDPETGEQVMPDPQRKFLDWLVDPFRTPETITAWAKENGIDERSVRRWKNDPRFVREWRARADEENVAPERVQKVIDNLWRIASSDQGSAGVKAAEAYLKYVNLFTPKQEIVIQDNRLDNMPDHALAELAGWAETQDSIEDDEFEAA